MRSLIPAAALLLVASPAVAGMRWTIEYAQGPAAPTRVTYATDGAKLRMEAPSPKPGGGSRVLIFDAGTNHLFLLDPTTSTYLDALAPTRTAQDLSKLPADMKSKPATPTSTLRFAATGKKDTVGGARCEVHKVTDGDRIIEEVCVVPWGKGAPTKDEQAALDKLRSAVPGMSDGPSLAALTSYPGYPVRRRRLDLKGAVLSTETMTSFQRSAIPAAELAVPSTYKPAARGR